MAKSINVKSAPAPKPSKSAPAPKPATVIAKPSKSAKPAAPDAKLPVAESQAQQARLPAHGDGFNDAGRSRVQLAGKARS
jgi:hypothetical protein